MLFAAGILTFCANLVRSVKAAARQSSDLSPAGTLKTRVIWHFYCCLKTVGYSRNSAVLLKLLHYYKTGLQ